MDIQGILRLNKEKRRKICGNPNYERLLRERGRLDRPRRRPADGIFRPKLAQVRQTGG